MKQVSKNSFMTEPVRLVSSILSPTGKVIIPKGTIMKLHLYRHNPLCEIVIDGVPTLMIERNKIDVVPVDVRY